MLKRLSVVILAALALACGGDDRPVLMVGADGASFQREVVPSTAVGPIATVPYVVWNRGGATAFIPKCGGHAQPVLERLVNGSWESYSGWPCIEVMAEPPIELRAGESRRDLVAIGDAGHFRILMTYAPDAQWSKNVYAVSGPFDVH
jgi:hypothetical protein